MRVSRVERVLRAASVVIAIGSSFPEAINAQIERPFPRPTRRLRAERRRNPSCSTASRWIRAEEMMMTARLGIAIAFAALVLVGCGTTQDDRAISGAPLAPAPAQWQAR